MPSAPTVVFDLGNVLIRWNPRNLYRKLFGGDTAAMEAFLTDVCPPSWNEEQDRGRPWAEAVREAVSRHPAQENLIRAYDERWLETLGGPIDGSVDILRELKEKDIRLLALTNWSAEKFSLARPLFGFLEWFEGILVSGEEGLIKPDPAIFHLLATRYALDPARTVFIDDALPNIASAARLGFTAVHFTAPEPLRSDLASLGLPVSLP